MYTYRASELGGCIRRLVALRQGYEPMPPPPKFRTLFDSGKRWEEIAMRHLRERGFVVGNHPDLPVDEGQSLVYIRILEDVGVSGHPDTFVFDDEFTRYHRSNPVRGIEIKSMSQEQFDLFVAKGWERGDELMEKYKWQVSVYMLATGLEWQLLAINRDSDEEFPDTHSVYAELPFHGLGALTYTVLQVERLAADEGYAVMKCNKNDYPCPVYYLDCTGQQITDDEVVSRLIVDYDILNSRMKVDEKAMTAMKVSLGEALGTEKKIRVQEGTVSWTKARETKWLDETQMVEDGIDVESYRRSKRGAPYVRVYPKKDTAKGEDVSTDES